MEDNITTTKIIDNTIVSLEFERPNLKIISKVVKKYPVETSYEVYNETLTGFNEDIVKTFYSDITIKNKSSKSSYQLLLNYFKNRFPYLHDGEVSSFLIALLEYHLEDKPYYYVSDDNRMRQVCRKELGEDEIFLKTIKKADFIPNFVGTIGLIKHLFVRNLINKNDLKKIILEIENSTFRITPDIIKALEGLL